MSYVSGSSYVPFKKKDCINFAKTAIDLHNEKLLANGCPPACMDLASFEANLFNSFLTNKITPPSSNTGGTENSPSLFRSLRSINTNIMEFNGCFVRLPSSFDNSVKFGDGRYGDGVLYENDLNKKPVSSDLAFMDYLSFSFKIIDYYLAFPQVNAISADGDDLICCISDHLVDIFGFGVTENRGYGQFNYKRSWVLGNGFGLIMCGGNVGTAFVSITGQGLTVAEERVGYQQLLYDFMVKINASITRIDLAHDLFDGFGYSVDLCRQDYIDGAFYINGVHPKGEMRGNWDKPDFKGRSYYVGTREGGKMVRVYEKGLQLGGVVAGLFSDWVRIEVEYRKTSARPVLPLDMILLPGQYLAGAYPALGFLSDIQKRIITTKSAVKITADSIMNFVERTCSKSISFIYNVLFDSDDNRFIRYLKDKVFTDDLPKRLLDAMPSLKPVLPDFVPAPAPYDAFIPLPDDFEPLPDKFKPEGKPIHAKKDDNSHFEKPVFWAGFQSFADVMSDALAGIGEIEIYDY